MARFRDVSCKGLHTVNYTSIRAGARCQYRCQVQSCLLDNFLADQVMTRICVCRVQPSKRVSKLAIAVAELGLEHAFRPRHA